jgi:hypothetical protein
MPSQKIKLKGEGEFLALASVDMRQAAAAARLLQTALVDHHDLRRAGQAVPRSGLRCRTRSEESALEGKRPRRYGVPDGGAEPELPGGSDRSDVVAG